MDSTERHTKITAERLAQMWNIGLATARRTLDVTTQLGIRTAVHPLHRMYRVDHLQALNRRRLRQQFYVDHLVSRVVSLDGCRGAWIYTNGCYTRVYPVDSREKAGDTLTAFTEDVGIPSDLRADLAAELTGKRTKFQKEARRLKIKVTYAEVDRKNQNHAAELEIRELKRRWRRKMSSKSVPRRLWDYGLVHIANILNVTARGPSQRTGYEEVMGETPDISEYCDFDFYDQVWYFDRRHPGVAEEDRKIGRWLGISHRIGSTMCYWILTKSGRVIARTTVQHVTRDEYLDAEIVATIEDYNRAINERLNDANHLNQEATAGDFYLEDEEEDPAYVGEPPPPDAEYGDMIQEERPERDDISDTDFDGYIGATIDLTDETGKTQRGIVRRRARDHSGELTGKAHKNPLLDTRQYEIELDDGKTERYYVNQIVENLHSQVDSEGRTRLTFNEIVGHRKDGTAVRKEDGYEYSTSGNKVAKKTTKGWKILVEWRNGTADWVSMKDVKASNPIELAEYAVAAGISDEPAFAWWAKDFLKRRDRIIAKAKSRYWRTTHKFGIRLPHSVEEALRIDEMTGTDYWRKAIEKEMRKAKIAWKARDDVTIQEARRGQTLVGFQEIKCHIIFDVKMDLTRKARFVAGGHMTEAPVSVTYSSVVSRESVRLALLIAALNDLDLLSFDVGNAYLNAPCREKIWFVGGIECGEDRGKVCVLERALYGLKSAGASWRAMFASTLRELGFESTIIDPDVYRRKNVKANGQQYYELILVYVDDCLVLSHQADEIVKKIGMHYHLKPESVGEPSIFLGANIEKYQLPDGRRVWSMSCEKYLKNAIETVKQLLSDDGRQMNESKRRGNTPLPYNYKPELDVSDMADDALTNRYQQLIGIARWAVELGRIDMAYEVAIMSQYNAAPRLGHLEAMYHMFFYVTKHMKSRIVFDPVMPERDESVFQHDLDWQDFYPGAKEDLPDKMPEPLGNSVDITCFVDANHAGNVVTRRSHSGIIIYVQNAPIIWYSKRQNTVEASTFGSELVAMRIAKELIVGLRIKLRMFGVPVVGPASILCDNQGVVKNTSLPASTLSKKHNSINYHSIREAVAANIVRVGKEDTETNVADLLTKLLAATRRKDLLRCILYST